MRALTPDSGSVVFNDRGTLIDVLGLEGEALKQFRRRVQFIFQDPFGSLNPRMTVQDIIVEPLVIHDIGDARSRRDMVSELVTLVGLDARATCGVTRTAFPAGSASASASPAHWRCGRNW